MTWIHRLLKVKKRLGVKNQFILYMVGFKAIRNLNNFIQRAWQDMGMTEDINVTRIRTPLADLAKSKLSAEDRELVTDYVPRPQNCEPLLCA